MNDQHQYARDVFKLGFDKNMSDTNQPTISPGTMYSDKGEGCYSGYFK